MLASTPVQHIRRQAYPAESSPSPDVWIRRFRYDHNHVLSHHQRDKPSSSGTALPDPVHIRVSPLHIWKAVGLLQTHQEMELFLAVFAAYAMTQPYAEIVLKLLVVFWLVYAVLLISAPKSTTTITCGSFKTWDETSKLMIRMIGFNILAHIGVVGSILFGGAGNLKAFGIGYSSSSSSFRYLQMMPRILGCPVGL